MDTHNERTAHAAPTGAGIGNAEVIGLDRRQPLMRVDFSLNIPTIIAILTCVIGVTSFGFGIYRDLDNRQMRTDLAVIEIRTRLDKTETAITNVKSDQAAQTAALRGEMKGDIVEIKDMLNRLIFGGGGAPSGRRQQLEKDWNAK